MFEFVYQVTVVSGPKPTFKAPTLLVLLRPHQSIPSLYTVNDIQVCSPARDNYRSFTWMELAGVKWMRFLPGTWE